MICMLIKYIVNLLCIFHRKTFSYDWHRTSPESSSQFLLGFVLLNIYLSVKYFVDHCVYFVFFILVMIVSACRATASDYPFCYFKFLFPTKVISSMINKWYDISKFM